MSGGPVCPPASPESADAPRPASPAELFWTFSGLALRGFGGVLPWAQRVLVEERRWLTREQFLEVLAFGQLLPGPNICNVSLILGDRWFGWRGAVAALAGMLVLPFGVVLAAALAYAQWAEEPAVRRALVGMGSVAAGLILATAVKLAGTQRRRWRWLTFGVAAFVGVAVLRWPLAAVIGTVGPLAVASAWIAGRRAARPSPAAAPADADEGPR